MNATFANAKAEYTNAERMAIAIPSLNVFELVASSFSAVNCFMKNFMIQMQPMNLAVHSTKLRMELKNTGISTCPATVK